MQAVLTGRVLAGTAPVPGAVVWWYPTTVQTDDHGSFCVERPDPIDFRGLIPELYVRAGGLEYAFRPTIREPVQTADCELQVGSRHVVVRSTDAEGRPVASALEVVGRNPGDGALQHVTTAVPLPEAGVAVGPLPPWRLHGALRFADGFRMPVVLEADAAGPIVVQRPSTATLRVRVLRAGTPADGLPVIVVPIREHAGGAGDTAMAVVAVAQDGTSDATGIATLPVLAGAHRIEVIYGSPADRSSTTVTVAAGEERTIEVQVPR